MTSTTSAGADSAADAAEQQLPRGAPVSALASRLALHALVFGTARAVAALWGRFARELRFSHWEPRVRLPRIPPGPGPDPDPGARRAPLPDLRAGLLHQKLQVLDHCIALLRAPGLAFEPLLQPTRLGLWPESEGHAAGMQGEGVRGAAGQGPGSEGGGSPSGEESESDYGTASEGESWAAGYPRPCSTLPGDPPGSPAARPVLLVSRAGEVTLLPPQPAEAMAAPAPEHGPAADAAHTGAQSAAGSAAGSLSAAPRGVAGALFCAWEAGGGSARGAEFVAHAPHVRAPAPVTADELEERGAALAALGMMFVKLIGVLVIIMLLTRVPCYTSRARTCLW